MLKNNDTIPYHPNKYTDSELFFGKLNTIHDPHTNRGITLFILEYIGGMKLVWSFGVFLQVVHYSPS